MLHYCIFGDIVTSLWSLLQCCDIWDICDIVTLWHHCNHCYNTVTSVVLWHRRNHCHTAVTAVRSARAPASCGWGRVSARVHRGRLPSFPPSPRASVAPVSHRRMHGARTALPDLPLRFVWHKFHDLEFGCSMFVMFFSSRFNPLEISHWQHRKSLTMKQQLT